MVSTPILDLIRKYPNTAGKVFYRLMRLKTSDSTDGQTIRFDKFDVSQLYLTTELHFNYTFFDQLKRIRKQIKNYVEIEDMDSRDFSRMVL